MHLVCIWCVFLSCLNRYISTATESFVANVFICKYKRRENASGVFFCRALTVTFQDGDVQPD